MSQATVSLDLAAIRAETKERLNNVIEKELPMQWIKTRTALQLIQREALKMFHQSTSASVKLASLQAFGNAQREEFELVSNSHVIDEALRFVSNKNLDKVLTKLEEVKKQKE